MNIFRLRQTSWLLLLGLTLGGCSEPPGKAELQDYQQRLNRVLALDTAKVNLVSAAPLPTKNSLAASLPDLRMDLLDAFATRQCGLDQLIAERNSSMGKVLSASKRLHYEVKVLNVMERCLTKTWDAPLQGQLVAFYSEKQQSIATAWRNMLLTDDTLRRRWHSSDTMLAPNDTNGFNESLSALKQLLNLQQAITAQDWATASTIDPEQALATLYQYDFLSRLQFSLRYTSSWFDAVNPALLSIEPASLCARSNQTEQLTILNTVFRKFFIGEIQAYLAELMRYQQQSWPLIAELYQDTAMLPVLEQRFGIQAEQLQRLLLAHVGWYQQLNSQCAIGLTG